MSDMIPPERSVTTWQPFGITATGGGKGNGVELVPAADFREIGLALRRHWWVVLGFVVIALGTASWYVHQKTPRYRAKAAIRIANARQQMTNGLAQSSVQDRMDFFTDPLLSHIQVLTSRSVAAEVVRRAPNGLQLRSNDVPSRIIDSVVADPAAARDSIRLTFADHGVLVRGARRVVPYGGRIVRRGVSFVVKSKPRDISEGLLVLISAEAATSSLQANLEARPRKSTDVIDIEYAASDPQTAQRVVNTAALVFKEQSAHSAQQLSSRRRRFIEEQLEQTDSTLVAAQGALTAFQSTQPVARSSQRITEEQAGILGIEARRGELTAERRSFESLLSRLRDAKDSAAHADALRTVASSPTVTGNIVVASLYTQLAQHEIKRDSLLAAGAARTNPELAAVRGLAAETEGRLTRVLESYVTALDDRIAALEELKQRNIAALRQLPAVESREMRFEQQVETIRKVADQLREEYQRARIAEAVETGEVELLDPAPAGVAIGDKKGLILALALLFGLLGGGALALTLERVNTSVRGRDEIEGMLRVPMLALIPRISRPPLRVRSLPFIRSLSSSRVASGVNGNGNGHGKGQPDGVVQPDLSGGTLVSAYDARSSSAEAYRTLRTNLIFSEFAGTLRSILVTSPSPGDGKTTTVANLAVAFAHQGVRVLLVDCDLRRARLHEVFGIARDPGLSHVMLGYASIDDAIHPTTIENLSILPSGRHPPNPSELLGSNRMRTLLRDLGSRFDVLLIDSPPVLAASDAPVLATGIDGVLLVVRAGRTERSAAQAAIHQLRTLNARTLGVVLNDPDAAIPKYGNYYYYYSYYGETQPA